MPLTTHDRKTITLLDKKVKKLWKSLQGDHHTILAGMAKEMPKVQWLLDHANRTALDRCASHYPYFHRFMKILEKLAQEIASGSSILSE